MSNIIEEMNSSRINYSQSNSEKSQGKIKKNDSKTYLSTTNTSYESEGCGPE